MTGIEVFTKINQNNKQIEELINPTQFTLNSQVEALLQENESLRKNCPHHYINNKCEYCGKQED